MFQLGIASQLSVQFLISSHTTQVTSRYRMIGRNCYTSLKLILPLSFPLLFMQNNLIMINEQLCILLVNIYQHQYLCAAIFAMKSHFGVLRRYHYVITTATTFTTCDLKEKKIMRHSVQCLFCCYIHYPWFQKKNIFIIFYYVDYAMVLSKRSKSSFQRNVHDAMIMKNIRFTLQDS